MIKKFGYELVTFLLLFCSVAGARQYYQREITIEGFYASFAVNNLGVIDPIHGYLRYTDDRMFCYLVINNDWMPCKTFFAHDLVVQAGLEFTALRTLLLRNVSRLDMKSEVARLLNAANAMKFFKEEKLLVSIQTAAGGMNVIHFDGQKAETVELRVWLGKTQLSSQ